MGADHVLSVSGGETYRKMAEPWRIWLHSPNESKDASVKDPLDVSVLQYFKLHIFEMCTHYYSITHTVLFID